jgi:hypothetical protein
MRSIIFRTIAASLVVLSLNTAAAPMENGDVIRLVHPTFVWVTVAGYRLRPPQWK